MSPRNLFRLFAAAASAGDHVSDCELLRRFIATRDSAAFELIVRRHADAVWVAGLRILGNAADAEDVLQATFLALVRKAGSVRDTCIGGWLHRIAVNAALKLKARRAPGVSPGVESAITPGLTPGARLESLELAAVVQEELARLPDRYRLPVVLCDLEGQTHAEAATALGWPVGSVSGRLSRAHIILRDRLSRRGLAAPVALVAAATAPASVVHAATAVAAGSAIASPVVASLTEGVLSAMRIAKLKLTAAVVASTGFVALAGVGTGYALTRPGPQMSIALAPVVPLNVAQADEPKLEEWTPKKLPDAVPTAFPDLKPPAGNLADACPRIWGKTPLEILKTDDTYRRLLKARVQQCCLELSNRHPERPLREAEFRDQLRCKAELLQLIPEVWASERVSLTAWLEEMIVIAKYDEAVAVAMWKAGKTAEESVSLNCISAMRRHRLEAEAALWKAKQRK